MLDIAWPELIVIGAVALVAIPPKDLPKVMHSLGQWAGKARRMMHDINRTFEQLSYEAEVADKLKKEEKLNAPTSPPTASEATVEPAHERPVPSTPPS